MGNGGQGRNRTTDTRIFSPLLIIGLTGHLNAWRQMINLVHKGQVYQSG